MAVALGTIIAQHSVQHLENRNQPIDSNTMESAKNIKTGTGVQTGGRPRSGDYSSMAIDPTDDFTIWYAQKYFSSNGFNWHTRMASFKFTGCM